MVKKHRKCNECGIDEIRESVNTGNRKCHKCKGYMKVVIPQQRRNIFNIREVV